VVVSKRLDPSSQAGMTQLYSLVVLASETPPFHYSTLSIYTINILKILLILLSVFYVKSMERCL